MQQELAYGTFYSALVQGLLPLSRLFFIVQMLNLGMRNCDHMPETFCVSQRLWEVDSARISRYEQEAYTAAQRAGVINNEDEFRQFVGGVLPETAPPDANISRLCALVRVRIEVPT